MYLEDLIPARFQPVGRCLFLVATIALMVLLLGQGKQLQTETAPCGIVSFELAWSVSTASAIKESWSAMLPAATTQIHLDFPFLICYSLLLSMIVSALGRCRRSRPAVILSWAVLAAAPLDAIENFAMLRMLDAAPTAVLVKLTTICAVLKFGLVLAVPALALLRFVAGTHR